MQTRWIDSAALWIGLLLFSASTAQAQVGSDSLAVLKKMGKNGKPSALYQVGVIYEEGRYERANLKRAIDYYKDASALQYDSARFALGRLYEIGKGLPQDFAKAAKYYKATVQKNAHAEAFYRLGTFYEQGLGVEGPDQKTATEYYLMAWRYGYLPAQVKLDAINVDSLGKQKDVAYIYYKATKGDAKNQYFAGRLFQEGVGFDKDFDKAFDFFQKSAAQGFDKAEIALGDMYAEGKSVKRNMRMAVKHYLKAAQEGDPEALERLKELNVEKQLDPNSLEYLSYKALTGEATNQYELYQKYYTGSGVPVDYERALKYCQEAASKGYEKAMMAMANFYTKGILVDRDPKTAFDWYRRAALVGNDSAKFMLAEMYSMGEGVDKDETRAVRYYLSAANSGVESAMKRLNQYDVRSYVDPNDLEYVKYKATLGDLKSQLAIGKYYFKKNSGQSARWLRMAAEQGNTDAQVMLGEIYYKGKCNMPIDNEEALHWFSLAAGKKEPQAFRYLADMYVRNLIPSSTDDNLETAFEMAKEYLTLKKGKLSKKDAPLYKIMGDIYMKNDDYANAIIYYTEYIKMYDEEVNEPRNLMTALENRASAYENMQQHQSAATDLEILLLHVEDHKEHEDIKYEFEYIKGYYLVQLTEAYMGMENYFKACNTLQKARRLGAKIPKEFIETCERN